MSRSGPVEPLKPCPFCGCSGEIEGYKEFGFWVGCQNCGAEAALCRDKKNAVEVWNMRWRPS